MKEDFKREVVRELKVFGMDAKEEIITQTGKGLDYQGRSFVGYTPRYKKFKAGLGRNVSRPDLRLSTSGGMLSTIQYEVIERGSRVILKLNFASNFSALKALGNMRTREFFAISRKSGKDFLDRMTNVFRRLK